MLNAADAIARRTPNLFSLEMWGGATFDTAMRFLREDPWQRLRQLREAVPNICFQMLFRGSNAVGYSDCSDNVVKAFVKHSAERHGYFPDFRFVIICPTQRPRWRPFRTPTPFARARFVTPAISSTKSATNIRSSTRSSRRNSRRWARTPCIKDMAGLCRPYAANKLVKTLRQEVGLPIHFHTHDTSGVNAPPY